MSTVILVLYFAIQYATCSKILVVGSLPPYSHFSIVFPLVEDLANKHQVTFLNLSPKNVSIANCNTIFVKDVVESREEINFFNYNKSGPLTLYMDEAKAGEITTEKILSSSVVETLLNSENTIDLVIIEHFYNEALVGIAHHFKAPVILLAPLGASLKINLLAANPAPSSYVPNILSSFSDKMNLWQRFNNFLLNKCMTVLKEFWVLPKQRSLFKKYFKTNVELDDVLYNISLILTYSHFATNGVVPHVPNVIDIGGYHITKPQKLPQHVQAFLDEAKDGAILFSLGSILESTHLAPQIQKIVVKVFAKMKQKVLWKLEANVTGLSINVKILKWLPQKDILAHPNVRAVILHGGLLSLMEAVHYGVPVIGIPIFADQRHNIGLAVKNGYAVKLPLDEITEETFSWAIDEILNNTKYKHNAQKFSRVITDRLSNPLQEAVYWIEYIIRHKKVTQLKSMGLELSWYQQEMLDIFAIFVVVTVIFIILAYKIKSQFALKPSSI